MSSPFTCLQKKGQVISSAYLIPDYSRTVRDVWSNVHKTLNENIPVKRLQVSGRKGWKTVRIFVSSTFRDFHSERELLVKEVFPRLRNWCEQRRIHLIDCDLRWGVPSDSTTEFTMRRCLSEIERCKQDNVQPFFLNMTSERVGWVPGIEDVSTSVDQEFDWVQGLSLTEMEIVQGAFRDCGLNSLFMIRNRSFINDVPEKYLKEFIDNDAIHNQKLKKLKTEILFNFPHERVINYTCNYKGYDEENDRVVLDGLDIFGEKVFNFFRDRIEDQYPLMEVEMDLFNHQYEMHHSFMENRGASVIGRRTILEKIEKFICEEESETPMCLLGGPGLGKSSIMAKAADNINRKSLKQELKGTDVPVFYHFVGATPGSTDTEFMLKRLIKMLNVCPKESLPTDYSTTCQTVYSILNNEETKPFIMLIDAVNQLDNADEANAFAWLPNKHVPQVRIVFSMITNSSPHKLLLEREAKPVEVPVPPLDIECRKEMVTDLFSKYNKILPENEMDLLLAKESSANPLWLSIACEELRVFGNYKKVAEKIISLQDDLLLLLSQVLKRFESEFGGKLFVACLCLLECSRHGLLESELLWLLGDEENLFSEEYDNYFLDDEEFIMNKTTPLKTTSQISEGTRLPYVKWSKVYHALRQYLRPFGESGEGRLDFYHRSVSKAVRITYFKQSNFAETERSDATKKIYQWWHTKLAVFFKNVKNISRKVEEYPYQLLKLNDLHQLREALLDWEVIDYLYHPEYSAQLLEYWRCAVPSFELIKVAFNEILEKLEPGDSFESMDLYSQRYERIGRILLQAGKYNDAKKLINVAMSMENEHLGGRLDRLASLHESMVLVWDGITKLHGYYNRDQIYEVRPLIEHARQVIAIRKAIKGDKNKHRLGFMYVTLAFHLKGWTLLGGTSWLPTQMAGQEAEMLIKEGVRVFEELGDEGKLAEATMTDAVIMNSGHLQIQKYKESEHLCKRALGDTNVLMTRIYNNTGIAYEETGNYKEAYLYFRKWFYACSEVFGKTHPKTKKAYDVLHEPMYVRQANNFGYEIPREIYF